MARYLKQNGIDASYLGQIPDPPTDLVNLTSSVTLTAPISAAYLTGLTQTVTVPEGTKFLEFRVSGDNATVTAAATVTLAAFTGAAAGDLTTQFGLSTVVAPTGGTTVSVNSTFYLPVTSADWGLEKVVSIGASASTGNYVLNAAATSPCVMACIAY